MTVSFQREGAVAIIAVDDGKANAFSPDVLMAISEHFDKAERDGATAVVLQGRPGCFSAGFDLAVMTSSAEAMRQLVAQGADLFLKVFMFPAPVVAACTGHALAAGALALLVSDVRIGMEGDFRIGLNEVALGVRLPIVCVEIARYRMPPSAFDQTVLGEVFDPDAAVRAGYLDRTSTTPLDDTLATAQRLAALRTGPFRDTKRSARGALVQSIRSTLAADLASLDGPAT